MEHKIAHVAPHVIEESESLLDSIIAATSANPATTDALDAILDSLPSQRIDIGLIVSFRSDAGYSLTVAEETSIEVVRCAGCGGAICVTCGTIGCIHGLDKHTETCTSHRRVTL